MGALLDKMLAKMGKRASDLPAMSKMAGIFRRHGVQSSSELDRIKALPRRRWQEGEGMLPEYDGVADLVTEHLRASTGEMRLRHVQAVALVEMADFGGLFANARAGIGKTLITLLAPTVLEAKRPLLLVPAKLRAKTLLEIEQLRGHWQIDSRIRVVSYELLGRVQAADQLEVFQPDLIVADEAHKLKNTKAAVTRRVRRYMAAHEDTKFVAVSGTISKRSLHDYSHVLRWCLPKHAPLPKSFGELCEWADALDDDVDEFRRFKPGALAELMNDEERAMRGPSGEPTLKAARSAFRRRLVETPGVIVTTDDKVGCSLSIEAVEPSYGPQTDEAFRRLRRDGETPDGHPCADGVDVWRHARELACGFFYKWSPYPPMTWLAPRKAWCKFVREKLKHSRHLDSEEAVAREHPDAPERQAWLAVRKTFEPNVVPVWLDDGPVQFAAAWLRANNGIVWVEHQAVGQRLAEVTGVPYYGAGGVRWGGGPRDLVELADTTRPIIASIASNSEGRNILKEWSRNLVLSMPPAGLIAEQLLARTHRDGQRADEVSFEVVMGCVEQWECFQRCVSDARYVEDTLGQEQRLLYADKILPSESDIASRRGARWDKEAE